MTISGTDFVLVDTSSGVLLNADSTVLVPEILGAGAYDVLFDEDAAAEYGEAQGVELDAPGTGDIPVDQLDQEPRGYWAIDLDTGYVCVDAADLRLVPYSGEDPTRDEALELADQEGQIPEVPAAVRELAGIPFESVNA